MEPTDEERGEILALATAYVGAVAMVALLLGITLVAGLVYWGYRLS